jgi:O-Antigen ligase
VRSLAFFFEGQFFYGAHLRWDFGWATPNYAGTSIVVLLCFAWVVKSDWRWWALAFTVEMVGYFLLAKTYSRGSLVALGAAAVFYSTAQGWRHWQAFWRIWMSRLFFLVACIVGTGLASRMDPRNLSEDGAVTHRLDLWRGGLEMIAAAPWRGWGAGESGVAYMNWFQATDRTEGFTTIVNSYLHLGVEHGLPILGGVICGLAGLLVLAWRISREGNSNRDRIVGQADRSLALSAVHFLGLLMPAAGASIIAWAVANVFTTLWIEPKLWIVPAVSCAIIVLGSWRSRKAIRLQSVLSIGVASASVSAVGLFLAGEIFITRQGWRPEPGPGGTVAFYSREFSPKQAAYSRNSAWHESAADSSGPEFIVWIDRAILGDTPGKEIRRWMEAYSGARCIIVCDPRFVGDGGVVASAHATWVLAGDQCWRLALAPADAEVVLLHPRGLPPQAARQRLIIVLPEFDQEGTNSMWQSWANEGGNRIEFSPQTGEDIRTAWPAVMTTVCEQIAAWRSAL